MCRVQYSFVRSFVPRFAPAARASCERKRGERAYTWRLVEWPPVQQLRQGASYSSLPRSRSAFLLVAAMMCSRTRPAALGGWPKSAGNMPSVGSRQRPWGQSRRCSAWISPRPATRCPRWRKACLSQLMPSLRCSVALEASLSCRMRSYASRTFCSSTHPRCFRCTNGAPAARKTGTLAILARLPLGRGLPRHGLRRDDGVLPSPSPKRARAPTSRLPRSAERRGLLKAPRELLLLVVRQGRKYPGSCFSICFGARDRSCLPPKGMEAFVCYRESAAYLLTES